MPAVRVHVLSSVALAAAVVAQTPLQLVPVATGLVRPVLVAAPPVDLERAFVVEQPGRIRIVKNGVLLPTPFLDITSIVGFGGEAGLLGLAFHPDYATNRQFFVCYSSAPFPALTVARYSASATNPDLADPASATPLLVQPMVYGNHNGGMIAFGPDRMLYVSIGDGGSTAPLFPNDPFNHAQRGDSLLGKMLRIDVDTPQPPLPYGIPPTNPFAGPGDPRDEIWALGFRNPWRFGFDRLTGDLWLADVGGLREEVDFEPAGAPGGRNYGWACASGTQCTGTPVCTCNGPALTLPLHEYGPLANGMAIIGGYVYRGVAVPDLRGAYFYADHIHATVWSLRRSGAGITQLTDRTVELTPPPPHVLVGPTSFGEDAYGELYLCDLSGTVFRIAPATPVVTGVAPYGTGTPGCSGPHTLSAPSSPVLGHPAFTLRTGQAPVSGLGLMAFAAQPDVAGSDPFGLGFVAHLQVASLLSLWTIVSDGNGVGSFAFAIPPSATLIGAQLHGQSLWLWSPAICSPSPLGWSSSPGLSFTVQP